MNGTFKSIRKNWPIIAFVLAIAAAWGQTNARISANESKLTETINRSQLEVLQVQVEASNVRLDRIETKLDRLIENR